MKTVKHVQFALNISQCSNTYNQPVYSWFYQFQIQFQISPEGVNWKSEESQILCSNDS